ncbi:hypothetical protein Y032_0012g1753 [Ancylostoma ceylanicum]|uniref:Uncharacterized protein n=1 Tax=Ancylostoma ceylanicum TaxID=53326 RepID=A0A016VEM2_9BILA|nr:hypothetical protein Y032_0012g1753 [Ancylostoma ceylanicum]
MFILSPRWENLMNLEGIIIKNVLCKFNVFLKNPFLMLHRPSAETRRVTYALSHVLRRSSAYAQCNMRQEFLRKTALDSAGTGQSLLY